ncbi:UTP--glucose-1-phosphate uridylyltransferase [Ornithinimicrobium sp. W1679]|uniref:UTP--glucose-1-phosphate uridylyltransferase n=1 Tax=Ornithinimicrobium sp. W1679 TaxID=3418770 RepID=UPI003CF27227
MAATTQEQQDPFRPGREAAVARMRAAGVAEPAVRAFERQHAALAGGASGLIREADVEPVAPQVHLDDLPEEPGSARAALDATAVVVLNGGLGTSMGLSGPKSLLPVHDGLTFLDLTVRQVLALREASGARLPLLLMDSFATRDASLERLAAYPDLVVDDLPPDVLQSREPKLRVEDLAPVDHPADPRLEWCPPGHGDLYPTLLASGVLDALLERGYRHLFVSNVDNLGAVPDPRLAAWFAASGAGYAAEVCPRTAMDRKGGHLVRRRADGRLLLRDTAQTASEDMGHATDGERHPWVHTNSLWLDLPRLRELLHAHDGALPLPLIRNTKTVDPTDPTSTPVVQVESAMGGAVALFDDAVAVGVGRDRFVPVKGTDELLLLRSDVYEVGAGTGYRLLTGVDPLPVVSLDPEHYRFVHDLDARFPDGAPSLRESVSLQVRGDWTFGAEVVVRGRVRLDDRGGARRVPDGTVLEGPAGPGPAGPGPGGTGPEETP